MAPPPERASVEELLQHQRWLRELALELAHDAAGADELLQRTWLAALLHPPLRAGSLRGWLASVVRNFARQERRARSCRAGHEQQAAAPEAQPSVADVLERAGVQRVVAEAVFGLEEPYRTTVMLRYFDDLPPRAIAEAMGVPVETVRTRLARALAQLRLRLDRERGGREAWLSVLTPLLPRSPSASPLLPGSILMSSKILVSALILLTGSLAFFLWTRAGAQPQGALAERAAASAELESPAAEPTALPPTDPGTGARSELAAAAPAARSGAGAGSVQAAGPVPVRGRVIDERGAALAQVPLAVESDGSQERELVATSGPDGRFEIPRAKAQGLIVALREGWTTLLAGVPGEPGVSIEPVVVVARAAALSGRVFGEEGLPLAGARVEVALPETFRTRLPVVLDRSVDRHWARETDAQAAFAFGAVPLVEGARIHASADGYQPFDGLLADSLGADVLLTLARPRSSDGLVRGKVVDAAGEPVDGALVAFGVETTRTEKDGTFAFALQDPKSSNARFGVAPETLSALKPGFQPALFTAPRREGKPDWPATVTLRLGAAPLSITGRVVGHDGVRLAGVQVWLADAALFGAGSQGLLLVENVLAGDPGKRWRSVETDRDGRFELAGLVAREYTLRAMDPNTLLHADRKAVAAGSSAVEVRLPTDELIPKVAGVVVGRDGSPVAGAKIFPMCDAFRLRAQGSVISTSHAALDGTRTDGEGRFELLNLPKSFVYLRIEGEELLPLEYGRDTHDAPGAEEGSSNRIPEAELGKLRIVVQRRCHLQVELSDPGLADGLCILDEQGRRLEINVYVGKGRRTTDTSPIEAGKSHTMAVSDAAATLVLLKGEAEVSRTPLRLKPGETTTVRP
jgi:RNA polymerase sigma factor (sigma-70 family)